MAAMTIGSIAVQLFDDSSQAAELCEHPHDIVSSRLEILSSAFQNFERSSLGAPGNMK